MKNKIIYVFLFTFVSVAMACSRHDGKEPWTEQQLMQPSELAKILNDKNSAKPVILSIGFGGGIKNSKEIGPAKDKDGIENLRREISVLPKNAEIIIYCGCCPFNHCPNIRPAFELLNEMKFTKHKLLNLSQNLKVDWIDKGYPME